MQIVFRTTWKYWAAEDGFGLLLLIISAPVLWILGQNRMAIICIIALPLFLIGAYKKYLSRLIMDAESIQCFEKDFECKINWSEIIATEFLEQHTKPKKTLVLGTSEGFTYLSIDHFDYQRIWQLTQQFAPAASFEKDAIKKMPGYEEWQTQMRLSHDSETATFRVSDHLIVRISGWLMMLLSGACFYAFWEPDKEGFWFGIILSAFFFLFGLVVALMTGSLQIDRNSIIRSTLIGKYQIRWDEITSIEEDVYGSFILHGLNKYLMIYGPGWWSGKDKASMAEFLFSEIELRQIEIKSIRISLKIAKNTKIK